MNVWIATLDVLELRRECTARNGDVLGQLGVVLEFDIWARMYNIGDVQLLLQPGGIVHVDWETRDEFFRGAYARGGYTPSW